MMLEQVKMPTEIFARIIQLSRPECHLKICEALSRLDEDDLIKLAVFLDVEMVNFSISTLVEKARLGR